MPRRFMENVIDEPVEIDVRFFWCQDAESNERDADLWHCRNDACASSCDGLDLETGFSSWPCESKHC